MEEMIYTHPLTALLNERHMSNRQVAHAAGLDPRWVDRLVRVDLTDVNFIRRPSIERLERLAAVLGVEARELVDPTVQTVVYDRPADQPLLENIPEAVVPRDLQAALRAALANYSRSEHASRYLGTAALTH